MHKKFNLSVIVGILLVVFLVGCSKPTEESKQTEDKLKVEEVQNNELILALGSEPEAGFDPTIGWGRYGSPLFQSTLLARDQELKIVNDLASDYEVSEDGLVWMVTLREDVVFSDGEQLTAEDVVYTFEKTKESGSVVDLNIMEKVEATNEFTVVFTLKQAQSTFIHSLATTGIVPKHAHHENYAQHPIGSGPFKFIQWDKGQQLIVEANELYYGEKPFFKKLTFLFLGGDAAFAAAKAGQVDIAAIPAAFTNQDVSGMQLVSLESVDNRGIMFPAVPSGEKKADGILIGNDVTADEAIRKAINVAINRQLLVDGVLEGHGTPAYTSADKLPWWNPETVINDGDIDEAKKILTEAGWVEKGTGILEKGNVKAQFTLVYPASDVTRQSLAIAVADLIKPLGINIIVEGKSWDDIQSMMHSNAVLFGWGSHDPLEMYNLYSSSYKGVEWYNTGFYGNEKVDAYMERALKATTEEEALIFWKKAQWDGNTGFSAHGDAPWAWLVNLNHLYLVDEKLNIGTQKIQPHGHGWPITDNIAQWKWNN